MVVVEELLDEHRDWPSVAVTGGKGCCSLIL